MRKFLIPLAAAASAFAVAPPASAQIFGNVGVGLGVGSPGYGYGYNGNGYNDYGQVRSLQYRVNAIQRQINVLDRRNVLSEREADRLRDQSRSVERRLWAASRYGLTPYEAQDIQYRIARLEQRVQRGAYDGNGRWGGYNGYNGYNGYYGHDRDRDRDWDGDGDRD
jgi:hypothetical protein